MDNITTITQGYKKQFIEDILNGMTHLLDNNQLNELNRTLNKHTTALVISENPQNKDLNYTETNNKLINGFIKTKKLKGLSLRTLNYYQSELERFDKWCIKSFIELTSDDLKEYLRFFQKQNDCSKTTVNNVRRILSTFYKYMENEELIIINPLKSIPAIKESKKVRKAFTDEEVEKLRNQVLLENIPRNIAIFEMLISSGLRIGEITTLKKDDISLADCKGVCLGKGNKQRIFYFSERTKLALQKYLNERIDNNPSLFVQRTAPYNQLGISGAEYMIRQIGAKAGVTKVHPHRFRRTLATRLIRKGMAIDQVSNILGHESLSITQRYIESDTEMLRLTHKKHTN